MKKLFKSFLPVVLCLAMIGSMAASAISPAYAPYLGYEYNSFDESVAAPVGYLPSDTVDGSDFQFDINVKSFTDIALDDHIADYSSYFILDGKSGIVYKTDLSLNLKCLFDNITDKNGNSVNLKGATQIACDYSNSYFYVYKNNKIYIISSLSRLVKTINVPGVVSMTTYAVMGESEDLFDTYLCVITSDKQNGMTVYGQKGKKLGFFALGKKISDITFSKGSDALVAMDEGSNQIGSFNMSVWDGAPEVSAAGEPIDSSVNLKNAYSITADSMGFYFYITMSNNRICCMDAMMGDATFIDSSSLPENVLSDSMKFTSISYNSTDDTLVCLGNEKGPYITKFNINGGFVSSINSFSLIMSSPTDMQYVSDKYVYILDSGNSRILKLNKKLNKVLAIFANFYDKDLGYIDFYEAKGFAVDEKENIYIADTSHERVVCADKSGNVRLVITRPDEQLADTDAPFSATKVMLDRKNQIYVLCDTINLGAFVFNQDGEFKSFFASNSVTQTADVILNFIRKQFLTREQMKAIRKSTPIALTNFDVDSDGFVYTVTETDQSRTNNNFTEMVRKLNYQGDNVFTLNGNSTGFGDFEWDRQDTVTNTSFGDIDVDDGGYINLIDNGRGKIFQYTEDGNLVTIFGGFSVANSEQLGRFDSPSAIESIGENIYVLDKQLNNITVFTPTDYTVALRHAYDLLDSSDADSALEAWSEVLKYNTNSQYPYYGMGRAYEMKGDYENAMKYFKLAYAKPEYSKAYKEYRKDFIGSNIGWIALILIVLIAVIVVIVKVIKKHMVAKHGEAYSPLETKGGLPIYVLLHPVDGFEQFRTRNLQSIPIALGLVIAYFLVKVFEFFATGFAFNNNRPVDYDLFANVISTIGLYVLFVIANWAVCTLLNGKGRMKDIMCVTGYALTPLMLTTFISVAMSNVMCLDEAAFVSIVVFIGTLWSAIVLLMGLYTVHQYSFLGTVGSVILTVLGMAIIGLLVVMFFTLLNQFYSFIISVISELKLR